MFARMSLFCVKRTVKCACRQYSNRNMMWLKQRGMLQDIFPSTSAQEITDLCNKAPQCVYAGFDPTAESLHVGNLLVIMNLLHWQRGGHQVIALIGGATGRIGDPSGRSKDRELLENDVVRKNVKGIAEQLKRIFQNHEKYYYSEKNPIKPIIVVDNSKWYSELNVVDFFCKIGRHFRMGTMLSRSSVASRLASEYGMSFTEFSYQVFQGYDWVHLLNKYDCRFQIGGSDQMGNIMSGHELVSRVSDKTVYGFTMPLITAESGDKFGKSMNNAVWLDSKKTSPFDFYQFFIRTPDSQVNDLLRSLTFLPVPELNGFESQTKKNPEKREAQKCLADYVTLMVHGTEGLEHAKRASAVLYNNDMTAVAAMSLNEISAVFKGAPVVEVLMRPGVTVKELAMAAGCFIGSNDADRIIKAGGFYINNNRAPNPEEILVSGLHFLPNNISLLRVGKRNYWIVKWLS